MKLVSRPNTSFEQHIQFIFQFHVPSAFHGIVNTTEHRALHNHHYNMTEPLENVRPMFELRGRSYIVTGGAQGIGFAVTRAICEMGGNVAVLDIQEKPVDVDSFNSLSEKFKVKTLYIQTDVTKEDSLHAGFEGALKQLGTIDGCVPCAGIAIDKPFIEQTWEEFTRIQEINVSALHLSSQSFESVRA